MGRKGFEGRFFILWGGRVLKELFVKFFTPTFALSREMEKVGFGDFSKCKVLFVFNFVWFR
jgi:hypothetical protein